MPAVVATCSCRECVTFVCLFGVRASQVEWETDRGGMPAMTSPLFFNAVFELIGTR